MLGIALVVGLSLLHITNTREIASDAVLPVSALGGVQEYMQYKFGSTFGKEESECMEHPSFDGRCSWIYFLGDQGPCADGKFLRYNKTRLLHGDGVIVIGCYPKPCPADYGFLIPDRKCYHNDYIEQVICPEGLHLNYPNAFGETYCSCDYREATLFQSNIKKCYTLYTQGPCKRGSLFVPRNDLINFGFGECVISHCAKFLNGNGTIAEIRLPSGQTGCFEVKGHGPCQKKQFFDIVDSNFWPGFSHLSCEGGVDEAAFRVAAKNGECIQNDKGECVKHLKHESADAHPWYLD